LFLLRFLASVRQVQNPGAPAKLIRTITARKGIEVGGFRQPFDPDRQALVRPAADRLKVPPRSNAA
jgi:hypothetical protein